MKRTVLCSLLLAACANLHVRSELAPEVDPSRYHTFAWAPLDGAGEQPTTIIDQRIRAALAPALEQKGFRENHDSPDFLVSYHVLHERKTGVSDWGNGLSGWTPEVVTYTEGTLIVDFIDPSTNAVFWRGSAHNAIEPPGQIDEQRLQKAAVEIVRHYPSMVAAR